MATVTEDTIEAFRVVPPPRSARASVETVEQAAALGWRAPDTARLGDWLLRAAAGFTRRANSALAIGDPGLPLPEALQRVAAWYDARSLPPRLLVPDPDGQPEIQAALTGGGWRWSTRIQVLTAEVSHVLRAGPRLAAEPVTIETAPAVGSQWLELFRPDERPLPETAATVLEGHPSVRFVLASEAGRTVAVARVAVDGRWAGLHAVRVVADRRRLGLARLVTATALREAGRLGARQCYLHVEAGNDAALALYRRLGFAVHHESRYAVTGRPAERPRRIGAASFGG